MDTTRRTARTVGVLFIVATGLYLPGNTLSKPILGAPDYLINLAANAGTVTIGALLEVIAAFACAGIAIGLYPVLRRHHEALALGAVAFRLVEAVFYIVAAVGLLSALTLSQEYVQAGGTVAASFQAAGTLLLAVRKWAGGSAVIAFALGALMYYYAFYQSRLIPRWLSGWGALGAALTLAAALSTVLGWLMPMSTVFIAMNLPIGLQEMVLAVWLIVKGLSMPASAVSGEPRSVRPLAA